MPKVKDGPKKLNDLLESAYAGCMSSGGTESSCSQIAWGAAKNAGWKQDKDGNWKMEKSIAKRIEDLEELYNQKNNIWNGVL